LAVGAAAGLGLAALGVLRRPAPPASDLGDAVARVNGRPIPRGEYERALSAVAAARRDGAVEPWQRAHVLARLIDEELLVQRALELGIAARDPRVRADLAAAMVDLVVARGEEVARAPSEVDLREFYARHRDLFRPPPLVALEQAFFRVDPGTDAFARARAMAARARLTAGVPAAAIASDPPPIQLPREPLPPAKLWDYLGPTVTRAAVALTPGQVSEPLRSQSGYHVLRALDRRAGEAPPFVAVRERVRIEYGRRAGDERLRRFLEERRAEADIQIAEGAQ
jgi:peptidylprolyl isomerase